MSRFKIGDMVICVYANDFEEFIKDGDLYIVDGVIEFPDEENWRNREFITLRGVADHGRPVEFKAYRFYKK